MICDKCRKRFTRGNRRDGIPNGFKMIPKSGKPFTLCAECIISLGKMNKKEKEAFFDDLKGKK